jgi:oxygen-independent coproporphyrinogen-3 oxidase
VIDKLGIYLHFPFCTNHCSYCDFYKETYVRELQTAYFQALKVETEKAIEQHHLAGREVDTLYIGGGTPSLVDPDLLAAWLEQLRSLVTLDDKIEFSLECNPESTTLDKLSRWRELGVTRPIFGIQSFHPKLLKRLGRKHRLEDSQRAIYHTNALGYVNFGVDLIFALPGQTSKILSADVDTLLSLAPPHISFYQLTVEPGTKLEAMLRRGKLKAIDEETSLALYRGGSEKFAESGYERYEVSSFAREGFECRHNIGYWTGKEYLGLGPAAHSFVAGERFFNPSHLGKYLSSLEAGQLPLERDESGPEERIVEAIMLGLRMSKGIDRRLFERRFGSSLETHLDMQQVKILTDSGHVIDDGGFLRLSDEGVYVTDEITRKLLG